MKLMRSMETFQLDLMQQTTFDVKEMLQKQWDVLPKDQTLTHNGLKLPDDYRLSDCGVVDGSELELVVSSHCKSCVRDA